MGALGAAYILDRSSTHLVGQITDAGRLALGRMMAVGPASCARKASPVSGASAGLPTALAQPSQLGEKSQ